MASKLRNEPVRHFYASIADSLGYDGDIVRNAKAFYAIDENILNDIAVTIRTAIESAISRHDWRTLLAIPCAHMTSNHAAQRRSDTTLRGLHSDTRADTHSYGRPDWAAHKTYIVANHAQFANDPEYVLTGTYRERNGRKEFGYYVICPDCRKGVTPKRTNYAKDNDTAAA